MPRPEIERPQIVYAGPFRALAKRLNTTWCEVFVVFFLFFLSKIILFIFPPSFHGYAYYGGQKDPPNG